MLAAACRPGLVCHGPVGVAAPYLVALVRVPARSPTLDATGTPTLMLAERGAGAMIAARRPAVPASPARARRGGRRGEQQEDHPLGTRGMEGVPGRGVRQGLPRTAA